MINKKSVKQAMDVDIAISSSMVTALELWTKMYTDDASWLNKEVISLRLPSAIASEIARTTTIEMGLRIEGSKRADYLAAQMEKVLEDLRTNVEFLAAKGGLIFKPYVDGKNINIDYVHADQFFPVAFDTNGNITSCVFVDQRTVGDKYYTRLEYHDLTDAGYKVKNQAYKSTSQDVLGQRVDLSVIDDWEDLSPEADIKGIDQPMFAYCRYPLANSIDPASPLGVSCYSRAVNLIEDADKQWSRLIWEFESGQRALYVDVLAFQKDSEGKPMLPNKRLYRTLESGSSEADLYEEWSPNLREQNILNGLDSILKRIEFSCGLAYGTLSDPNTVDKTATEIKTSKQRTYATIVDTQKALQGTLDQLLYAMDKWATLNKLAPKGKYTVIYDWDDSIIIDKDAQFQQDLRLISQGVMGQVEFRMRNMGEDEETAKQKVAEARAEQPTDVFDGGE